MSVEPSYPGTGASFDDVREVERRTAADGTWPVPKELVGLCRGPTRDTAGAGAERVRDDAPAPRFPRPPRPARPPGLTPELQERWREVLARHDAIVDLDHFALLDIPYEATLQDVQLAFTRQIQLWHPDRLPSELGGLLPYAMRILARLNDARNTLTNRSDREAYLRRIGRAVPATPRAVGTGAAAGAARPRKIAKLQLQQRGVAAIAAREQRLLSTPAPQRPPASPRSRRPLDE